MDVIKDTKIGQGLKFLPQKLADLTKNLQIWLEEFVDTGKSDVRKKVAGLLEELLRSNEYLTSDISPLKKITIYCKRYRIVNVIELFILLTKCIVKIKRFSLPHAHAQWIVKTSGPESLMEISNWLVGRSRSGVYSY